MKRLTIGLFVACAAFGQTKNAPAAAKNAIGMEFVKIPTGEFTMGCPVTDKDCIEDEVPRHKVRITKQLEVGKYEVTQAQWEAVMGKEANPSEHKGPNFPVELVTKSDIQKFLDALNAKADGSKYRLPTEAEWEYFARASAPEPPRESLGDYAWYNKNSDDESHPVGQKKPNAWGLYDVLGNVREFVSDTAAYYDNFTKGTLSEDGTSFSDDDISVDPTGPGGRGGGGGVPGGGRGPGGPGGGKGGPGGGGPGVGKGGPPGGPPPGGGPPGGGPGRGGPGGGKGKGPGGGNAASGINPAGFDAKGRLAINGAPQPVTRGGGWDNNAPFVRLSARYYYYDMDLKLSDLGFRVVREAQAQ